MTSKQLYWTDAHFCGLRSQTNVYGLSKISSQEGLSRLLTVSIDGHFVTIEYQKSFDNRLIPMTREGEFFMASTLHGSVNTEDIEIVSVDMMYQDGSQRDILLAVTYLKLGSPYEEKPPSAFMNVYFLTATDGTHIPLVDAVATSEVQPLELLFIPFKVMHQRIRKKNGATETCILLSGNDNKVHVFTLAKSMQEFYEDPNIAETYFPEFKYVSECVTQMELKQINPTHRLSALGVQSGAVDVFLVNTVTCEIERHWQTDMDSPITSIQIFTHHVESPTSEISDPKSNTELTDTSESSPGNEDSINLLITSAIDPALVFCDILENNLSRRHILPLSNTQDVILCSCVMDIDFDGENEILIGTYGQVLLAYKLTMDRTPGMLMTSTPFQSPKPVPVLTSSKHDPPTPPSDGTGNVLEDKSPAEQVVEKSDRRRHKSMAASLDTTGSPSKHDKQDRHKSDNISLLDGYVRDAQMARLVRSQENLASASPRSVYFQTPDAGSDSCEFLQHMSLSDISDGPSYRLKWTKRFSDPVMGLTCEEIMGDGMLDLVVLTLKGLHILQPDLNEVADLLMERMRTLAESKDKTKEEAS